MEDFKAWWEEQEIFAGEGSMDAAQSLTAKRCKEIAQQRYLAENQAVVIDEKISKEFGV